MQAVLLSIIQFFGAIVLIPLVMTITPGFVDELAHLGHLQNIFMSGVVTYALLQLFFYTPQGVFQSGQQIIADLFKAVPLLSSVGPLFIPLWPTLLLLACYMVVSIFRYTEAEPYFLFFAGFTGAMHLIACAHAEFGEDDNVFKARYLFLMSLTYLFTLVIVAFLLSVNFPKFSFSSFFVSSLESAKEIYVRIFHQLFIPR